MNSSLFLLVLFIGAATAGLAAFIRAIHWPKSWLKQAPLGCPLCMSGWSGFAVLGLAYSAGMLAGHSLPFIALTWLAALSISAPIFKFLYPPEIEIELPSSEG